MTDDRHDRVRRRAYELWEQQGGEHGRHEDHWHSASAEIDGGSPAEEASIAAPDGTTLTTPAVEDTAAEAKPARKRAAPKAPAPKAAPKAAAKPTAAEKAPAKPRKAK